MTIGAGDVAKAGAIVLHDANAGGSFTTTLASNADVGENFTLTLPADDGSANQVLSTDGLGALSWSNAAAPSLDDAYDNFGATASKITIDASESQTGGLEFELSATNNPDMTINMQGTGDFIVQDAGTALATFADDGSIAFVPTSTYGMDATGAITIDSDAASTLSGSGVIVSGDTGSTVAINLGGAAGDDLIVDTTTLVVESDNNRVGIGTATPDSLLHIYGDAARLLIEKDTDSYWSGFTFSDTSGEEWGLSHADDNTMRFTEVGVGYPMVFEPGGNVGIGGVTNPATVLEVEGLIRSTDDGGSAADYIEITHGGANSYINHGGTGDLNFRHSGTTYMTLESSGDVGIGDTTPEAKLDIHTGNNGGVFIDSAVANGVTWLEFREESGANHGARFRLDGVNNRLSIQTKLDGVYTDVMHFPYAINPGNVGIGTAKLLLQSF